MDKDEESSSDDEDEDDAAANEELNTTLKSLYNNYDKNLISLQRENILANTTESQNTTQQSQNILVSSAPHKMDQERMAKREKAEMLIPEKELTEEEKKELIATINNFEEIYKNANDKDELMSKKFEKRFTRLKRYTKKMFEQMREKDEEFYVKFFIPLEIVEDKWDVLSCEDKMNDMFFRMERLMAIIQVRLTGLLASHDQKVFSFKAIFIKQNSCI